MKGLYRLKGREDWYFQPPTIKGVPRPKAVALQTKDEVTAIIKANEILFGEFQTASKTKDTLALVIPRYLASKSGGTKMTRIQREGVLGRFQAVIGNPKVGDINRQVILDWRDKLATTGGTLTSEKALSFTSVTSYTTVVAAFMAWCVREGLIRKDPTEDLGSGTMERATRRHAFHTVEERDQMLARSAPDYIGLILHLGFFAGLRVGEMLAINPAWLYISPDWSYGSINVQATPITLVDGTKSIWKPKTKRGIRSIPMHPKLLAFLKEYGLRTPFLLRPKKALFPNDDTKSLRFDPKKALAAHGTLCGLETGFHKLRHSFATHLAMGGMNMTELAMLMGNTVAVTENSYVGFIPRKTNALPGL